MMPHSKSRPEAEPSTIAAACGVSVAECSKRAAWEVCEQLQSGWEAGSDCDLLLYFASGPHREHFSEIATLLRDEFRPGCSLGILAEAVVGGGQELDGRAGVSALALRLPNADLWPFTYDDLPRLDGTRAEEKLAHAVGLQPNTRAILLLADPFSTPVSMLLPALSRLVVNAEGIDALPVLGGMASAASKPGDNRLILNDRMYLNGAIGVTLSGDFDVSCLVSQGCKPIGKPVVVTRGKRTLVQELGGRPALEVVGEMVAELGERERQLAQQGLLLGRVIDEYKPYFGRGDFLVRAIIGAEPEAGLFAVQEPVRVGQTVQLHVRDAVTADEDLQLLLDGQEMQGEPRAALMFTCNGRGQRMFEAPHHDAAAVRQAFPEVPLAGFFAAGEIGPIASESFLHGHTAVAAFFRERG
ncbi:MAG: FIST N-terminal domain-containing protein [Phycisphaerales bacterium JB038]